MGTRSLTYVYSADSKTEKLICLYQQYDGYPSGVGKEIANFLDNRVIVNGIGGNTPEKASNGMNCMAASLVSEFKAGIGGTYLYPTKTRDAGQEYEYHIFFIDGQLSVKVVDVCGTKKTIFNGNVADFKKFCESN